MARWLNEDMVEKLEEQRKLRDRAAAAGSTMGMTEQERLNNVFKKAHEDAMERKRLNVLANPGAEANTNYRHAVMRDAEMRAAREHEMERLGKELATREEEARQRRYGMEGQGKEAALANKEAAIRAAELQTASAEKIAGINTASAEKIAGINKERDIDMEKIKGENAFKVVKDQGDASIEVARLGVEGEREKASAMAKSEYAQRLMRERAVEEEKAWKHASEVEAKAMQMVRDSKGKISLEEARNRVMRGMSEPGKKRKLESWAE